MGKYKPDDTTAREGSGRMTGTPSLQQSGPLRNQDHPKRPGAASDYSSNDDDQAAGYGKTTGKTDHSRRQRVRRSY